MSNIPDSFKKKIDINNKKQTKKENCIVNRKKTHKLLKKKKGKIYKKTKKNKNKKNTCSYRKCELGNI